MKRFMEIYVPNISKGLWAFEEGGMDDYAYISAGPFARYAELSSCRRGEERSLGAASRRQMVEDSWWG